MSVQSFETPEAMFAAISAGVEQAKANTLPRQWQITYGDHWMRVEEDVIVFGYVHTQMELDASEIDLGTTPEELEYEHKVMAAAYEDGFRFSTAYSVWEDRGELGDTHVSSMVPITLEEFDSARQVKWSAEEVVKLPWFNTAVERLMLGV